MLVHFSVPVKTVLSALLSASAFSMHTVQIARPSTSTRNPQPRCQGHSTSVPSVSPMQHTVSSSEISVRSNDSTRCFLFRMPRSFFQHSTLFAPQQQHSVTTIVPGVSMMPRVLFSTAQCAFQRQCVTTTVPGAFLPECTERFSTQHTVCPI